MGRGARNGYVRGEKAIAGLSNMYYHIVYSAVYCTVLYSI